MCSMNHARLLGKSGAKTKFLDNIDNVLRILTIRINKQSRFKFQKLLKLALGFLDIGNDPLTPCGKIFTSLFLDQVSVCRGMITDLDPFASKRLELIPVKLSMRPDRIGIHK